MGEEEEEVRIELSEASYKGEPSTDVGQTLCMWGRACFP